MTHAFFLGVDLEERDSAVDATLTILEKEQEANAAPTFRLDHARRRAEDTPDVLADRIQSLVADRPYIGRTNIVVNRSAGPGPVLLDALSDRGLDPIAVTLTGGSGTVAGEPDEVGVSLGTADAIRTLAELHRNGHFIVEDHTTEAASHLARGLQRAAEVLDEADGNQDTPEAAGSTLEPLGESGPHVVSAALAAWCGTERSFDPSQHLKETPQTRPPGDDRRG
ncbi:MAG: hypothetical protein ABEL97_11020 [Salinibacter sp.]